MIYDFWCSKCNRYCDVSCLSCENYSLLLIKKIELFEKALFYFKDIFDDCSDHDPIIEKVRLNMACAFDTSVNLFDDVFNDSSDYTFDSFLSVNYPTVDSSFKISVDYFK